MKIVVISLERAADRRRRVVSDLRALGLEFELRDAVDAQDFPPEYDTLIDRSAYRRAGRPIRMGSIANWLSQRQAMLEMVEDGPEIMTLLEDDATFSPEFPAVLGALETTAEPFGIVFLHHGPRRPFIPHAELPTGHRLGWTRWSHFGSQGYVITRAAARKFLEVNPLIRDGIDRTLARYWHHGLTTYGVSPAVVHHRTRSEGLPSIIAEGPIEESQDPLRRARRGLFLMSEGVRKRAALTALVMRSQGPVKGLLRVLRP